MCAPVHILVTLVTLVTAFQIKGLLAPVKNAGTTLGW